MAQNEANKSIFTSGNGQPDAEVKRNQWIIEWGFNVSLIIGAFGHLVLYVEFLAPLILSAATGLAFLKSPTALKRFGLLLLMFVTMFIIDFFGYPQSIITLKEYIVWLLYLIVYLVLHEDPDYFLRGKNFLLFYIVAHYFFLSPFAEDPSRMGLDGDMSIVNPNDLGLWCVFSVIACCAEIGRTGGWLRIVYAAITIISSVILMLTVSRSALMFGVICVVIFMLLNAKQMGGVGPMFILLVLFGAAGFAIFFFLSETLDVFQNRMDSEEGSYSGRTYLYDEAIKVFLESPWLGTGKDKVNPPFHSRVTVPHNQYLGLGVHYGVWPVVFLVLFMIQLISKSVALLRAKQDPSGYYLATELFVFLLLMIFMSMTHNSLMLEAVFTAFYIAKILMDKPAYTIRLI